jgi:hypothetical protein
MSDITKEQQDRLIQFLDNGNHYTSGEPSSVVLDLRALGLVQRSPYTGQTATWNWRWSLTLEGERLARKLAALRDAVDT